MGIPLRGHRDDGSVLPPSSIHGITCGDGNFRAIVQLYSLASSRLQQHLSNAAANCTWLSPTIQNEISQLVGKAIQRRIVSEVQAGDGVFSVLADETTDVAHEAQLSVSIRYVGKAIVDGKSVAAVHERFLEFVNPLSLSGAALSQAIVDVLSRAGLDIKQLVGQGYDGASAMSGEFNGVQANMRRTCQSPAVYIHCVAHVLNLTLVHASELSAIRNTLGTVGKVANYFNSSNLRCQSLTQAIAEFEETRKEKIKIPCATRWVEKQDAVHTFFAVYPVVCDQLESLAGGCSSAASDAKALLDSITRSEFVVSLSILNYIMKLTKPLSTILQSSENDLRTALDAVERVKQQLRQWRENDAKFTMIFNAAQALRGDDEIVKPRVSASRRQQNRANPDVSSALDYYRVAVYNAFLDSLLQQLEDRFQPATKAAMMLSALLPRYAIDACFEDVREGCVLFSDYLDGTILDVEIEFESWQLACSALEEKPRDSLSSLDVCNDLCFPNIRKLLTIFATLPVSTATAERSFSVLKLLKSNLRSRMGEERLTSLTLAYIYSDTFDMQSIATEVLQDFFLKARKTCCAAATKQ
jgi:Domain of unknown function (DUF4371)/hAT family C-terminal dimerisation region